MMILSGFRSRGPILGVIGLGPRAPLKGAVSYCHCVDDKFDSYDCYHVDDVYGDNSDHYL